MWKNVTALCFMCLIGEDTPALTWDVPKLSRGVPEEGNGRDPRMLALKSGSTPPPGRLRDLPPALHLGISGRCSPALGRT